jgi:hypothetical protein
MQIRNKGKYIFCDYFSKLSFRARNHLNSAKYERQKRYDMTTKTDKQDVKYRKSLTVKNDGCFKTVGHKTTKFRYKLNVHENNDSSSKLARDICSLHILLSCTDMTVKR